VKLKWGDDVKLAILAGVTLVVLATLATSFPIVIAAQNQADDRPSSANVQDHMTFTREIAEQGTKLDLLSQQHEAMVHVPERMARVEERLDNLVRMVYAILGGVFTLLLKELWAAMQAVRNRGRYSGSSAGSETL
jgi:hypothetical protein